MLNLRTLIWMCSMSMMALGAGLASGQNYPNKTIHIFTGDAGGGSDFLTRLVAQELASTFGQPVVTDNRGGSPVIPLQAVAKSPPDGYTLLLYSDSIWLLPFMQDVPYDPLKDFAPITRGATGPNILTVHPSVPAKSVKELVALARSMPGKLNYGMGAAGSSLQMAPELFKYMAGLNILAVPYKGAAASLNGLIAGEVKMAFPSAASMIPHLKSDKLRALAITTLQPSPLGPGLPTMAESGFPGFEAAAEYVFLAPAGTPGPIVNRLNQEIVRILSRPDLKEKMYAIGLETNGSTPEQLDALIKAQMVKWGKLIKDAGLRPPGA